MKTKLHSRTHTNASCTYSSNWKGTTYSHSMSVRQQNNRWKKERLKQSEEKRSLLVHVPPLTHTPTPPHPTLLSRDPPLSLLFSAFVSLSAFARLCQSVPMWLGELLCPANKGTLWGSSAAKSYRKDLKVAHILLPPSLFLSFCVGPRTERRCIQAVDQMLAKIHLSSAYLSWSHWY